MTSSFVRLADVNFGGESFVDKGPERLTHTSPVWLAGTQPLFVARCGETYLGITGDVQKVTVEKFHV